MLKIIILKYSLWFIYDIWNYSSKQNFCSKKKDSQFRWHQLWDSQRLQLAAPLSLNNIFGVTCHRFQICLEMTGK